MLRLDGVKVGENFSSQVFDLFVPVLAQRL
jgi:hypothetical protein